MAEGNGKKSGKKNDNLANVIIIAIIVILALMSLKSTPGGMKDTSGDFRIGVGIGKWGWLD